MKKDRIQKKFLEELEKTPIVSVACEKVGISRNSIYRWRTEDLSFAVQMEEALNFGVDFVNDVAEGNVLNGIKKGDSGMTKYWLSSRHKAYRRPFTLVNRDLVNNEQAEELATLKAEKEVEEWVAQWFIDAQKQNPPVSMESRARKRNRSTRKPSATNRRRTNQ